MAGPSGTSTGPLKLVYPTGTDTVDISRDLKALTEQLDRAEALNKVGAPPIGFIADWGGTADPNEQWMICDGREISRTGIYAQVFAICSFRFGVGNGTTTFNLPDFRGRFALGGGNGPGLTLRSPADKGGEEAHLNKSSESGVASHNHQIVQADGVTFASIAYIGGGVGGQTGSALPQGYNNGFLGVGAANTADAAAAHNNMSPYLVTNKIIRVI